MQEGYKTTQTEGVTQTVRQRESKTEILSPTGGVTETVRQRKQDRDLY